MEKQEEQDKSLLTPDVAEQYVSMWYVHRKMNVIIHTIIIDIDHHSMDSS